MIATGRLLGVLSAAGVIALWLIFQFRNPYAPETTNITLLFTITMVIAAAIAAVAAMQGKHVAMYLLFFVMFFPLGLYMSMTPGMFRVIGWLQLAYLAAAVLVHRGIMMEKRNGSVGD